VMVANSDSYASDAALDGLAALDSWSMLDAPAAAAYRRFVGRLYQPQLAKFGFDPRAHAYNGEAAERSQRRQQIIAKLADVVRDPSLRRQLAAATRSWISGNTAALDPSWYGEGFGVYVESGGLPGARLMLDKALASQDSLLRPALLGALAHSGKADIATWLLNDVRDPRLRVSERLQLVSGVTVTEKTRDLGYAYLRDHLDSLLSGGAGIFYSARLPQVLAGFCSVERADAIMRDFGPKLAGKTSELELARTVERVRDCGVLKQARGAEASAAIVRLK
jgi:hypothetical protein